MNSTQAKSAHAIELLNFINDLRCIQCGHYVCGEWSAYDGKMYCQECWDFNRFEEERVRNEEVQKLKKRLRELGEDV